MAHTGDPSTLEVKAGEPEFEGHPQLPSKLETGLGYPQHCPKTDRNVKKKKEIKFRWCFDRDIKIKRKLHLSV